MRPRLKGAGKRAALLALAMLAARVPAQSADLAFEAVDKFGRQTKLVTGPTAPGLAGLLAVRTMEVSALAKPGRLQFGADLSTGGLAVNSLLGRLNATLRDDVTVTSDRWPTGTPIGLALSVEVTASCRAGMVGDDLWYQSLYLTSAAYSLPQGAQLARTPPMEVFQGTLQPGTSYSRRGQDVRTVTFPAVVGGTYRVDLQAIATSEVASYARAPGQPSWTQTGLIVRQTLRPSVPGVKVSGKSGHVYSDMPGIVLPTVH
ncbi:MAG: hypothetical protein KIT11_09485 [Fimbriimonadaceae bacterium]|nr:hypothetical protein [Fimbriimonadaceae bacterium]QYK55559.1 MAG: hypothetical protein KF733_11155 [Fimbriimonadaceae bacterium]